MNQYYDPSAAAAYAQAAAMATGAAANYEGGEEEEGDEGEDGSRPANSLTTWGNANNMNLNPLIFTNITSSPYFKVTLIQFKVRKGKTFLGFKSKTQLKFSKLMFCCPLLTYSSPFSRLTTR